MILHNPTFLELHRLAQVPNVRVAIVGRSIAIGDAREVVHAQLARAMGIHEMNPSVISLHITRAGEKAFVVNFGQPEGAAWHRGLNRTARTLIEDLMQVWGAELQ